MKILFRVGSQLTSKFLQFCILSEEGAAPASVPDVGVHHSPICRTQHTHHPSALVSSRFFFRSTGALVVIAVQGVSIQSPTHISLLCSFRLLMDDGALHHFAQKLLSPIQTRHNLP